MIDIRKMAIDDVDEVVDLIETHDDDDSEDAMHDFKDNGIQYQWVILNKNKIVGTSGFRPVPETENTAFITWTYVHKNFCKKGYGNKIFQFVLDELEKNNAKKIFIKISNYEDEDGNRPYYAASRLYEKNGFNLEILSKDFYDEGEDQLIYSKDLRKNLDQVLKEDEKPTIRFENIYQISETVGAYSFSWKVIKKPFFQKRSFTKEDLLIGIDAVRKERGRIIFITFPSNLPLIHLPLKDAGFKLVGKLKNYYEIGIDELHFVYQLNN